MLCGAHSQQLANDVCRLKSTSVFASRNLEGRILGFFAHFCIRAFCGSNRHQSSATGNACMTIEGGRTDRHRTREGIAMLLFLSAGEAAGATPTH